MLRASSSIKSNAVILWNSGTAIARNSLNDATDANYQTLVTVPVPAMGPNDSLEIELLWSFTGSTNAKNLNIQYGGQSFRTANTATAANIALRDLVTLRNTGATNSQRSSFSLGAGTLTGFMTTAAATLSIDSTISQNISIRCNWGAAALSETITLLGGTIKLIRS